MFACQYKSKYSIKLDTESSFKGCDHILKEFIRVETPNRSSKHKQFYSMIRMSTYQIYSPLKH